MAQSIWGGNDDRPSGAKHYMNATFDEISGDDEVIITDISGNDELSQSSASSEKNNGPSRDTSGSSSQSHTASNNAADSDSDDEGDSLKRHDSGSDGSDGSDVSDSSDDAGNAKQSASTLHKWFHRIVTLFLIIVCPIALAFAALSYVITEIHWFRQANYLSVVTTEIWMRAIIIVSTLLSFIIVGVVSAALASKQSHDQRSQTSRTRSARVAGKSSQARSRQRQSKTYHGIVLLFSIIVGLCIGIVASGYWVDLLMMVHSKPFNQADPQFNLDISFYVFMLPGLRVLAFLALGLLAYAFIVCLCVHAGLKAVSVTSKKSSYSVRLQRSARRQIAAWFFLITLSVASLMVISIFTSLSSASESMTGADYTGAYAGIPASWACVVLLIMSSAVVCYWFAFKLQSDYVRGASIQAVLLAHWKTPLLVVAVSAVLALVLNVAWPVVMQRFRVDPNAQELQAPFIQRNIDATRAAYGLDKMVTETYNATTEGKSGALALQSTSTAQIRLLDPQIIAPTFRQLEQSKQYYSFADTLSVDKYQMNGTSQDVVIAVRELNLAGNDTHNWVNDHIIYTHGYGVVAAYGNKVTSDGQPDFFEYGIPTQGILTDTQHYEPRIYFSPNAPDYSIVGSPSGTQSWEFDYPMGSQSATTTFSGDGGPLMSSVLTRMLYAIRFGSDQILFSNRVTDHSQILYYRSPQERVKKVAPYLTLDGRVYPAVVDGRVKWILDGYTTANTYPYAQMTSLEDVTEDSTTEQSDSVKALADKQVNYMRNSVKATVDAYDGSVTLYAWDVDDPVLQVWRSIFPEHYKPISEISGDLMSHIRYPEGLFKVQRNLLERYHVTDAREFFSGNDFWQSPVDPTEKATQENQSLQPPYYLTLQTGGNGEPIFSLTSSFIPAGSSTREILTGFLSADSDAGDQAGVIGPQYGTLRLQELPKSSNVPGPGQAQNIFNANAVVSQALNLLESGSTDVTRGNLLTLPLGGGLVYVEPVYVQSSGSTSYPLLKKVLVAFGESVGFADTLTEALDQVFGGNAGAKAGDASNTSAGKQGFSADTQSDGTISDDASSQGADQDGTVDVAEPTGPSSDDDSVSSDADHSGSDPSSSSSQALNLALQDAQSAWDDAQQALQQGDWTAYGNAQERLKEALERAVNESK